VKNKIGFSIGSLLSVFTFAMGITIVSTLLIPICKNFNYSIDKAGILFTANFFGFIIFNVIFSIYSSKLNKKGILIVCTLLYSIFTLLFTTAPSFNILLIYMIMMGGVGGVMETLGSTLVVEINQEREGFFLNFTQIFFGIGALIGPVTAGYLEGQGYNWRIMFIVTAVFGVISCILLGLFKMEGLKKQEEVKAKDLRKVFKIREFNIMIVAIVLYSGAEVGVWGWISTLLKQQFHATPFKSGLSVAIFWGFMIIGRIFTAKLTDKLDMRKVILLLSIAGTFFTFLLALSKTEMSVWILLALVGLSYSGIWPTIVAYGGKTAGRFSSSAYFLLIAAGGLGGMVFPYTLGILGKAASISITIGIIAFLMLIIVGLSAFSIKDNINRKKGVI